MSCDSCRGCNPQLLLVMAACCLHIRDDSISHAASAADSLLRRGNLSFPHSIDTTVMTQCVHCSPCSGNLCVMPPLLLSHLYMFQLPTAQPMTLKRATLQLGLRPCVINLLASFEALQHFRLCSLLLQKLHEALNRLPRVQDCRCGVQGARGAVH